MRKIHLVLLSLFLTGCDSTRVETRTLKQHITSNGDQIEIIFAAGHATANENIQVRKKTKSDDYYIQVFQSYDSMFYSRLVNDSTLQIVLTDSKNLKRVDTMVVDLTKRMFDAKRYTDSIERKYP